MSKSEHKKVYDVIKKHVYFMSRKYHLYDTCDDISGDIYCHFIQNGYIDRFDESRSSLDKYISTGVRNFVFTYFKTRSWVSNINYVSLNKEVMSLPLKGEGDSLTYQDTIPDKECVESNLFYKMLIDALSEKPLRSKTDNPRSDKKLISMVCEGYTIEEIAKYWGLSGTMVINQRNSIIRKFRTMFGGRESFSFQETVWEAFRGPSLTPDPRNPVS